MNLAQRRLRFHNQPPAATPVVIPFGGSPATPAAVGERITAGPLAFTVLEARLGGEATEMVLAAWEWNAPPADGFSYVVANVEIANEGDTSLSVDNDDVGFVTSARRIWARLGIVPPEPALAATLGPGETVQGWVAGLVEDGDEQIVLLFNCRALGGTWSERYVALQTGASLTTAGVARVPANETGRQVIAPAFAGEPVVTQQWSVTLNDVRFSEDVVALFPEADYRTTALASADPSVIPFWIAFQFDIQHAGNEAGRLHFPVDAFGLAQADGAAVPDVRILSSPLPELSGDYLPGGAGSGWYLIELPIDNTGDVLRFQPFRTDTDVRYLTWGSGVASPVPEGQA